jgi:nitrogen regulatory protein P-II 1
MVTLQHLGEVSSRTTERIKVEISTEDENVDALVTTITDLTRGATGDAVVAVLPVDRFLRVRNYSDVKL